jgi:superfamily I DNA/RNA helicase/mRNA-degrading endonuclease RelE of RelBE toxin-antitoxin system
MSTWTITITETFLNELLQLPKNASKQVRKKVKILEQDPISAQGDAKKLEGHENVYRVRIGDYRLLYTFGQGWVKLLSIRHRKEVYKGEHPPKPNPPPLPSLSDLEPQEIQVAGFTPPKGYINQSASADTVSTTLITALPYEISESLLKQWNIPSEYWSDLLGVPNSEALLELPLPDKFLNRILDNLFPRSIEEITTQPEYLLKATEDLDRFVEGDLLGFLLKLHPEQEKLLERKGPLLTKGGPGTGKSTLALHRVQKLVEDGCESVLFTTYTNTLVNYSKQLLEQLLGQSLEIAGVKVTTVDSLAYRYYTEKHGEPKIATENQCLGCLQTALKTTEILTSNVSERESIQQMLKQLGLPYLLEEVLDFLEGRGISTLEEYLKIERSGRKIPLRDNVRRAIWAIYQTWQERMFHNCYITWEQLRRQALEIANQLPNKPYQAVVIDEAQDLSPVALRFLLALVPSLEGVYLTGDAKQSIYQQYFNWVQVNSDLKLGGKRTQTLERNYRNTQQIATACASILQGTDINDAEYLTEEPSAYQGEVPTLLLVDNQDQQLQAIRDFLTNAARQFRLPLHSAAILCPTKQLGEEIACQLTTLGIRAEFFTQGMLFLNQPHIKVLTIHSAKGLEFPFLVVVGLNQGLLPHIRPHLPLGEVSVAIDEQRRLFYVGCSRAMRALMVCGSLSNPSEFLDSLCSPYWQRDELSINELTFTPQELAIAIS